MNVPHVYTIEKKMISNGDEALFDCNICIMNFLTRL